jgi:hypothetical protein
LEAKLTIFAMAKYVVACVLLAIAPSWAQNGQKTETEISAWNAVQEEMTTCAAFYLFAKTCAPEGAKQEELAQIDRIIERMSELALMTGIEIGMTKDAMLSRLKMTLEEQARVTDGKCVNYSSLFVRHSTRCKTLGEHPESIFREYMNR